jgi:hypothetical protein
MTPGLVLILLSATVSRAADVQMTQGDDLSVHSGASPKAKEEGWTIPVATRCHAIWIKLDNSLLKGR